MWSKIKASLRSAEARTPEELGRAIREAFSAAIHIAFGSFRVAPDLRVRYAR